MLLPPLHGGHILRRYKRFLADVVLDDGRAVVAHCPNTGAMTGCWAPGAPVQLSHSDNPRRKLAWTLERVDMGAGWVGVNTHRVNPVVAEAVAAGLIPGLLGYQQIRREVSFTHATQRSRVDLLLSAGEQPDALVEVKCVTLLDGPAIRFPDAVTMRGLKHLDGLHHAVQQGQRGVMLFAINRSEGDYFSVAQDVDPAYAQRLVEVVNAGVEVMAWRIHHGADSMVLTEPVPIRL